MELRDHSTCPSCKRALRITFRPVVNQPFDAPRACPCGWHDDRGNGLPGIILHREHLVSAGQWAEF